MRNIIYLLLLVFSGLSSFAQPFPTNDPIQQIDYPKNELPIDIFQLHWLPSSHLFWILEGNNIYLYNAEDLNNRKLVLDSTHIRQAGLKTSVENITWDNDQQKILIYTNSSRVWRENTKGDYWYFDLKTGKGRKLGARLPSSSLMFAKFSPKGNLVAYVSGHNLYTENLTSGEIKALTKDGTPRMINGTFDWVYEEELGCRDGFRWSPEGNSIAYWKVDATTIPNHLMIDNTDSLYPFVIPVEYPKAGISPSSVKVGVINLSNNNVVWLKIPGDPKNNYLPRMEWKANDSLTVMQLNRKQNEARLYSCSSKTGVAKWFYTDKDSAWVEPIKPFVYDTPPWTWINGGHSFLWSSEKDGWEHIYKVTSDGKQEQLLTRGAYDANYETYDPSTGKVFFIASPYDATQRYLYYVHLNNSDTIRLTPSVYEGTNNYMFSPDGQFATHINANINRNYNARLVTLKSHTKVYPLEPDLFKHPNNNYTLEKFKVMTADHVSMDGIMAKPKDFDVNKKYPVLFYVYGEPAATVANDLPSFTRYIATLLPEGYIGIAMDNRGTPSLKGREWRKSIYRKIGVLNSNDQAKAAQEILKWKFVDSSRIAVFGWSGGAAMTLNLLFRYPGIYKTGVAVAAVVDQHFYDNIYTERYMGLPSENENDYEQASPITFAKNLKGNLLYIHGTGDDNVHYKNAEQLINELIKDQKQFSLMIYPNRSHGIYEGEGTSRHLTTTITQYLRQHIAAGGR
jgi:dipeptidyl-peptidase 4